MKYYVFLGVLCLFVLGIGFVFLNAWVFNENIKSVLVSIVITGIVELVTIITGALKKALKIDI